MRGQHLSFLLIWTSFYEQLIWAPVLVLLAAAVGDPGSIAVAASAYSLANLGGNLLFGFLLDRTGRYLMAGFGLLAMAVTSVLHLLAPTPDLLVGARLLHGLAAAAVAPAALAVVSDRSPGGRRGEAMAKAGLVIAVASMISPALTGRMAAKLGTPATIGLAAACLALVGVITLLFRDGGAHRDSAPGALGAPVTVGEHPRTPIDLRLATVTILVAAALMFGQNVLFYALSLRGRELGMGPAIVGPLLSAFAVGSVAAFVPPLSRLADRRGRRLPLVLGLLLTGGSLLSLAWSVQIWQFAVSLLIYGLGFGLVFPAVSALAADGASRARRGLAYGLLTAAFSLGAIAGPLVSKALTEIAPPFAVAGGAALLGALGVAALYPRPVAAPRHL